MDILYIFAAFICLAASQSTDNCPSSITHDNHLRVFGDSCFQFVLSRQRNHDTARQDCELHGGTLALVKTPDIQDFLYQTLINSYHDFNDKVWIGLNDIDKEGEYVWEDGTHLAYSHWVLGEGPNAMSATHNYSHNDNDCVVMDIQSDGKWAEAPCEQDTILLFFPEDEEHSFICQYPLVRSLSTTTTDSWLEPEVRSVDRLEARNPTRPP